MKHKIISALGTSLFTIALLACSSAIHAQTRDRDQVVNSIGIKFAYIPPGEFVMGAPTAEAKDAWKAYIAIFKEANPDREYDDSTPPDDEKQHRVKITKGYYIGVYEVTQQEFQRVMGRNPSAHSPEGGLGDRVKGVDTSRLPVEMVSLNMAIKFCEKLSRLPTEASAKRKYRLPTEAEWEYACRAGSTTTFHFGDSLNGTDANCQGTIPFGIKEKGPFLDRTTTVGSYRPNAWGLYDMHGNVSEWCSDFLSAKSYDESPTVDPRGPTLKELTIEFGGRPGELMELPRAPRVHRGGGYDDRPSFCRSAARPVYCAPLASDTSTSIGFRVVVDIEK